MGKFVIDIRENGDHHFNLKASNGEVILSSQGYNSKDGCLNGIESVKKHASSADNFDVHQISEGGQFYFNLKAGNGQVIGSSEMYATMAGAQNGVQSVMNNAPDATVEYKTA